MLLPLLLVIIWWRGNFVARMRFLSFWMAAEDHHAITRLVDKYKNEPGVIALAMSDFDCFGGSAHGSSSLLLIESSLPLVQPRLQAILASPTAALARRVEAATILYDRTKDPRYLVDLYRLVQPAGHGATDLGRNALFLYLLELTAADSGWRLTPTDQPLPLTESQLRSMLSGARTGGSRQGEGAP